jgi:hypothetical protein
MTYPGAYHARQDETVLRDLEYLNQTYPNEVKQYQRKIAEILDKMDYEGSMIYDEYPDRYYLWHMAKTILKVLQAEQGGSGNGTAAMNGGEALNDGTPVPGAVRMAADTQSGNGLEYLIQVLMCGEIYRRRHGGRRKFIRF